MACTKKKIFPSSYDPFYRVIEYGNIFFKLEAAQPLLIHLAAILKGKKNKMAAKGLISGKE